MKRNIKKAVLACGFCACLFAGHLLFTWANTSWDALIIELVSDRLSRELDTQKIQLLNGKVLRIKELSRDELEKHFLILAEKEDQYRSRLEEINGISSVL